MNRGTFMLHARECTVHFDADGVAEGVTAISPMSGTTEAAKAPIIIGDPSYFPKDKTRKTGAVIRTICILDHPIEGVGASSAQIILPQGQIGRKHDVYVTCVGGDHMVAQPGRFVAIVSTTIETADPKAEVAAGIALLGPIIARFDNISDVLEPVDGGAKDHCFISSSLDASSHFETTATDVLDLYARITGEPLNMDLPTEIKSP